MRLEVWYNLDAFHRREIQRVVRVDELAAAAELDQRRRGFLHADKVAIILM